jgi:hypothetical protein
MIPAPQSHSERRFIAFLDKPWVAAMGVSLVATVAVALAGDTGTILAGILFALPGIVEFPRLIARQRGAPKGETGEERPTLRDRSVAFAVSVCYALICLSILERLPSARLWLVFAFLLPPMALANVMRQCQS